MHALCKHRRIVGYVGLLILHFAFCLVCMYSFIQEGILVGRKIGRPIDLYVGLMLTLLNIHVAYTRYHRPEFIQAIAIIYPF